jgi:NADH:ubiquinone oxidoreductase subunit H
LLSVAFLTLLERKILAAIQLRVGCSTVGFYGMLQPFADALKLLSKEIILPTRANLFIFLLMPILSLVLSLMAWFVIPFSVNSAFSNLNLSLIYIFAVSSISVYSILMAG